MSRPIAIIGAGLSGLTAARQLHQAGKQVVVFDKGRRVAGRMSTRQADERAFDHGAQYFTVRSPEFRQQVETWIAENVVAPWEVKVAVLSHRVGEPAAVEERTQAGDESTTRYVGVPGMNALCVRSTQELIERDVAIESGVEVNRLLPTTDGAQLWTDGRLLGEFAQVLLAIPAPQAATLLASEGDLAAKIQAAKMSGCWAAMVAFKEPLSLAYDAAFVNSADEGAVVPLSWIARNSSKPGRPSAASTGDCWVLHASPAWSEANMERTREEAAPELLAAFCEATGLSRGAMGTHSEPCYLRAHRWRYALPSEPLEERFLASQDGRLFTAGDWCGGPRVEGAYLSGLHAAAAMLRLE